MTTDPISSNQPHEKVELRLRMRELLATLDNEQAARASRLICDELAALQPVGTGVVLSFAPIGRGERLHEVDLTYLHRRLSSEGRLALPRIDWDNRTMRAMRLPTSLFEAMQDLEVRRHGVPEPRGGEPITPADLSAILVPGLAFDRAGQRLGRGAGYYDRFLAGLERERTADTGLPTLIGVCFDGQVVERVPTEAHDRRVEFVVSEQGAWRCRSRE